MIDILTELGEPVDLGYEQFEQALFLGVISSSKSRVVSNVPHRTFFAPPRGGGAIPCLRAMSRPELPPEPVPSELPNPNGHEITVVTERLPGNRPTDYDIDLPDGDSYATRFYRCQNCKQERNRREHFQTPCPGPSIATPLRECGYSVDDPRTRRALTEDMEIRFTENGPIYEVQSESGNTYEVDISAGRCSCPDWRRRGHELGKQGCKHLRRTNLEIVAGEVPQPNGRFQR